MKNLRWCNVCNIIADIFRLWKATSTNKTINQAVLENVNFHSYNKIFTLLNQSNVIFLKTIKIHCKEYSWFSNCFVSFFCYHFSKPIYHNILKVNLSEQHTGPKRKKKFFLMVGFVIYMSSLKKDPLGYSLSKKQRKRRKDEREEGKGLLRTI